MPHYVDGYILPVPLKNLPSYRRLARKMAKIFVQHGALEVRECVGDDLAVPFGVPFPRRIPLKRGETLIFSWITCKSGADRDRINAAVQADPRCRPLRGTSMPFDPKRMVYGGFKVFVSR